MNAPLRTPSSETALRNVVLETNRVAAPSAADRERITAALRARLGVDIVPEGVVRAAGSASGTSAGTAPTQCASGVGTGAPRGLGKRSWLSTVVGTGVVAGALGFVLGYRVGQRERPAPLQPAAALEPPRTWPSRHEPSPLLRRQCSGLRQTRWRMVLASPAASSIYAPRLEAFESENPVDGANLIGAQPELSAATLSQKHAARPLARGRPPLF